MNTDDWEYARHARAGLMITFRRGPARPLDDRRRALLKEWVRSKRELGLGLPPVLPLDNRPSVQHPDT